MVSLLFSPHNRFCCRQVWFDNGRSTGLKIEAASKAGVLGVGAWPVDNIDWTNQSQVRLSIVQ